MKKRSNWKGEPELLTDGELAERLRISLATLRRHVSIGAPRRRRRDTPDIRTIRSVRVGSKRMWVGTSVDAFVQGR